MKGRHRYNGVMRKGWVIFGLAVFVFVFVYFVSSFFKRNDVQTAAAKPITLTYYRFGESPNTVLPLIQAYQKKHPKTKVVVRDFYDLRDYEDTIVNELAEGRGPDIFSMPNTWIYKHQAKINWLPEKMMSVPQFRQTFVDTADRDLVRPDATKALHVYGLPLFVDSLAVYYNKDHFEDRLPAQGAPSATWQGIADDVYRLTKIDNDFIQVAGAALGRSDNIALGVDILYGLMMQFDTRFYDKTGTAALFASSQKSTSGSLTPGVSALDLFTRFALSTEKQYSWNADMADATLADPEVDAFVRGKVSLIFGYSDMYKKMSDLVSTLSQKQSTIIKMPSVRVAPFPQLLDPRDSTVKRVTLARYFAETVSRTSKHPDEAWDLLVFMTNKENASSYFDLTHRPTARRDLLDREKKDPVYGVFVTQSAYAVSAPLYNEEKFFKVFAGAITDVVDRRKNVSAALKAAEKLVTAMLPAAGFAGPGPYVEPSFRK